MNNESKEDLEVLTVNGIVSPESFMEESEMSENPVFAYRQVPATEIIKLRHEVLRQGLPIETAFFDGDDHPQTWHVALCIKPELIPLCCASFMFVPLEHRVAWQLRGMAAVVPKQGLGKALLHWSMSEIVKKEYTRLFWCNARVSAVGFYEKMGWQVVSDEFDVPTAGPHRKMTKVWQEA